MANRLRLNFQLETVGERKQFIENYLQKPEFTIYPLTQKEVSQISNYLLWGKGKDGKAVGKDLELETKNKTWSRNIEIESLEELREQISFNENSVHSLNDLSIQTKKKREVFSRSRARKEAPLFILKELESLWRQIDETDLLISFYEVEKKKKKPPIRKELLERFTKEELLFFYRKAKDLSQFHYLKKKHLLVELRREQFTFKDSYTEKISILQGVRPLKKELGIDFSLKIYPFGGKTNDQIGEVLFTREINPKEIPTTTLQQISEIYWGEKEKRERNLEGSEDLEDLSFDFRKLEDVYQLLQFYLEIQDQNLKNLEENSFKGELGELLEALHYYIDLAELTAAQHLILERKIHKFSNEEIRREVNEKFNKSYTTNYISTIYKHKIIPKINEAAFFHEKIVENLFYPENFKKCCRCGRIFLIDSRNFMRKRVSKDGFNSRCKFCDRIKREESKKKKEKKEKGIQK